MGGSPLFADIAAYWPEIVKGLRATILLSVTITATGLIGGVGVFGLSLSENRIVRALTHSYISLFIGTPLIVFLFLIYYGLPQLGVTLSPFVIAVFGFTLNVSAYNARYLTIAYRGLDQAELESARAQGFSRFQVFRLITAPQALRMSVPALTNQAIQNVKDSSITFLIQYTEFFAQMQEVASRTFLFFKTYLFTAIVYLLLVSVVVLAARWLEREILEDEADPAAQHAHVNAGTRHLFPVENDRPRGRLDQPVEASEQSRLAAARRPHDDLGFALVEGEADVVEHGPVAVGLHQVFDFEEGHLRSHSCAKPGMA
jgi:polar amino acid transport system permease protein